MIMKAFTAQILCIYVLIMQTDILKKKVSKKYEEVWGAIKKEIETINGDKKLNMGKILKILGSNLMMICQWISL